MGYDLLPINKELDSLSVGAFSWPMFLQETGMGYVLGYGAGMKPASYVYDSRNVGSPVSNDGYKVTSSEAKIMAKIARGYVIVQRYVNNEWEACTPEQVKLYEETNERFKTYRGKVHEDHLKWLEKFADWADKSKGFKIN